MRSDPSAGWRRRRRTVVRGGGGLWWPLAPLLPRGSCGSLGTRCGGSCCSSSRTVIGGVREVVRMVNEPQNLFSHHRRQLRIGGLVSTRRSSFDALESYYTLTCPAARSCWRNPQPRSIPVFNRTPTPTPVRSRPCPRAARCGCFPMYGEQPALTHRRRAAGSPSRWLGQGGQRRQPPQAATAHRGAGATGAVRHRTGRAPADPPRHADPAALRLRNQPVRQSLPRVRRGPETVHWSIPDPATAGDRNLETAFTRTANDLHTRIRYLLAVLATAGQPRKVT